MHVVSVLAGRCICCNDYVTNACSKYFICFERMFQLFYVIVVKLDLDVGLLSEEERASAGAMTTSMWGGGTGRTAPVWRESHPSDETGCGRGGARRWCGRDGTESSRRRAQWSGRDWKDVFGLLPYLPSR